MAKPVIENQINTDKTYRFDFIGKGKIFYIISLIIIITGIVFYFVRGFNFGIDFLGGNLMEIKFKQDTTVSEVRKVMEETGYGKSILQNTAPDQYIVRTVPINEDEKNRILAVSYTHLVQFNGGNYFCNFKGMYYKRFSRYSKLFTMIFL